MKYKKKSYGNQVQNESSYVPLFFLINNFDKTIFEQTFFGVCAISFNYTERYASLIFRTFDTNLFIGTDKATII